MVNAAEGSFVLPFWMGNPTVELPSQADWPRCCAPDWTRNHWTRNHWTRNHWASDDWARDHWDTLHRALELWCRGNGAALEVSATGLVW